MSSSSESHGTHDLNAPVISAGDLDGLLERVKAATGPDRAIDCLIWQMAYPDNTVMFDAGKAFGPGEKRGATYGKLADFPVDGGWEDWEGLARHIGAEPVTASIEAALALVERVLPGSCVLVGDYKGLANPAVWGGKYQNAKGWCSLSPDDEAMSSHRAHAETPPLAILAALLAARSALGEQPEVKE
jgi:hypothetical protein